MSNHKKENNINLMNQVFINSLINETPVNEEEKEEVSGVKAIKALLPPDVKKVEPGTKKEISRIDIELHNDRNYIKNIENEIKLLSVKKSKTDEELNKLSELEQISSNSKNELQIFEIIWHFQLKEDN